MRSRSLRQSRAVTAVGQIRVLHSNSFLSLSDSFFFASLAHLGVSDVTLSHQQHHLHSSRDSLLVYYHWMIHHLTGLAASPRSVSVTSRPSRSLAPWFLGCSLPSWQIRMFRRRPVTSRFRRVSADRKICFRVSFRSRECQDNEFQE